MKLKLPEKFAKLIVIQEHLRSMSLVEKIFYYIIDWKTRKSVNLSRWIKSQFNTDLIANILMLTDIKEADSNKIKVIKVLRFVHNNIKYVPDKDVWDTEEKWQTVKETWAKKTGDCEDGAILIYSLLFVAGVPDTLLRIVVGNVVGGGHAYMAWLSDKDGLEYPIDWCYWYDTSYKMTTPYVQRKSYNYGLTEWFSFNSTACFKGKNSED